MIQDFEKCSENVLNLILIQMGTLPPKLARMMVNFTAQNSQVLWDPFRLSTISMEAVILVLNTLASDNQ